MRSYTSADLEAVVRGQPVPPEVFRAILADPDGLSCLGGLLEVRDLLAPPPDGPEPHNLPDMDVTFEELALYAEKKLQDPARVAAVDHFLRRHDPDGLHDPHGEGGTVFDYLSDHDTRTDHPGGAAP
ncbi:MAG TPA: hypothetical protein VFA26_00975 [Gemmataceae bacterium]|nr:hypothetical protein [Gemmataceae bacterium]